MKITQFLAFAGVSTLASGQEVKQECPSANGLMQNILPVLMKIFLSGKTEACQYTKNTGMAWFQECTGGDLDNLGMQQLMCVLGKFNADAKFLPSLKQCFYDECSDQDILNLLQMHSACKKTMAEVTSDAATFCDLTDSPDMNAKCTQFAPLACTMGPGLIPLVGEICKTNVGQLAADSYETCKVDETPAPTASTPAPTASTPAPTSGPGVKNCTCTGKCSAWADPHSQNFEGSIYNLEGSSVSLYKASSSEVALQIEDSFIRRATVNGQQVSSESCEQNGVGELLRVNKVLSSRGQSVSSENMDVVVSCHQGPLGCLKDDSCTWYLNAGVTKSIVVSTAEEANFVTIEKALGSTGECFSEKNTATAPNWQCVCN